MSATHHFFLKQIENEFPKFKSFCILDYGCGNGEFARIIPEKKVAKYEGWEVSDNCIAKAKQIFTQKKYSFHKINKQNPPSFHKNSFDIILFIGVIQYMTYEELNSVLDNVRLALKDNGALLISTTTNHFIYKVFNIYRIFLPHKYISRTKLIKSLKKQGFVVELQQERGILFAPIFSNFISLLFDSVDRFVLNTRGELGVFGRIIRKLFYPLLLLEQQLPVDFGYTLFVRAERLK
ncbi:MAG: hypothetical protein A2632_01285 [Candidatus Pacebacteria bacterium RIFCSPHIGHO2_01_FULL_46_16]|nr:MAG: hypothetical protein A2632_01285 [Candidatus Pacebacteria bacterium RIFCSPHIGHO2_01_FULL_46_16]